MNMIVVGSKEWCKHWSDFYMKRAERVAIRGFKYEGDDENCWLWLFEAEQWKTTKPWA